MTVKTGRPTVRRDPPKTPIILTSSITRRPSYHDIRLQVDVNKVRFLHRRRQSHRHTAAIWPHPASAPAAASTATSAASRTPGLSRSSDRTILYRTGRGESRGLFLCGPSPDLMAPSLMMSSSPIDLVQQGRRRLPGTAMPRPAARFWSRARTRETRSPVSALARWHLCGSSIQRNPRWGAPRFLRARPLHWAMWTQPGSSTASRNRHRRPTRLACQQWPCWRSVPPEMR